MKFKNIIFVTICLINGIFSQDSLNQNDIPAYREKIDTTAFTAIQIDSLLY